LSGSGVTLSLTATEVTHTETSNGTTLPDGDAVHVSGYDSDIVAFSANTFDQNDRYAVSIEAPLLGTVSADNDFGANGRDTVLVRTGQAIQADLSVSGLPVAYEIGEDASHGLTVDGVTLTVTDAEFIFHDGISLGVVNGGNLVALNSSFAGSGTAGSWGGLAMTSFTSTSSITDCSISDGQNNLHVEDNGLTVSGTDFVNASLNGVLLQNASATITNNTFTDNGSYGIQCAGSVSGSVLLPNTYSGNGSGETADCD
jgi:parallel beta-helix repeat protein